MEPIILSAYTFQHFIIIFSSVPTVFPFLIGIIHYPRLNQQQKHMTWLSLITFIVGVASAVMWVYQENNLFIGHFYTIIQFILIAKIYQLAFTSNRIRKAFNIMIWAFSIFSILNTLFLQPLTVHNANATTLSSIIFIVLASVFFLKAITQPKVYRLEKDPMFWFSSGVILYFFCCLFIFAISNSLLPPKFWSTSIPIWVLHNVFMWIFFILTTIGVWISPKALK